MLTKLWPEDVLSRYIILAGPFLHPTHLQHLNQHLLMFFVFRFQMFIMTVTLIETLVVSLQCAILSPAFKVREFSITDVAPYPISLKWHSAAEEGLR